MRTPRRRPVLLVAALALVAVAGACASSTGEPDLSKAGSGAPVEIPAAPGFDGQTIRVGVVLPTEGPRREVAAERATGLRAYLDYVTIELGGAGTKYPVVLDVRDGSDPAAVPGLVADLRSSTVLLSIEGTGAVAAALPALADGGLLVPGLPEVDLAGEPSVLQVGTPSPLAAANARWWVLTESDVADDAVLCSAVQEGADAEGWQTGLERSAALDDLDRPLATTVTIPADAADPGAVAPSVEALRAAGCDVVFLAAGPPTAADLLRAGEPALDATFVLPTWSSSEALADEDLAAALAERLVLVGDGPTVAEPVGRPELVRIRQGYAPDQSLSGAYVEGYLQGKAVAAVLEAAVASGDLSPAGVRAAAGRLRSVYLDELAPPATFGPVEQRRPPRTSAVLAADPGSVTGVRLVAPGVEAPVADALATELADR